MEIIITVENYLAFQPNATNKYTSTEIQSAINLSYTLLDAECAGAITDRWPKTSTEEGYLTASQKAHIQNAFYIETQYVLMNGLDFSQGSDQLSLGSFNMSSNRPNRNLISPQALKELQLAGIWYQADFVQARQDTPKRFSLGEDMSRPLWIDDPLPQSVSDMRYIHKIAEQQGSYNKYLKYDDQGIISFVTLDEDVGKVKDVKQNDVSVVDTLGVAQVDAYKKEDAQTKVYYGPTAPTDPKDNDVWVNESTSGGVLDYNVLINKPQINSVTLQGNKSLSDIGVYGIYDAAHTDTTTYNAQAIDQKISESAAIFRGTFEGGTTRPESFDYDTFCKNQMIAEGITPTNNDYLFIHWTELEVFDRCKYTQSTNTWSYEYTINQIAQKQSDWNQTNSNEVDYIKNKPTIPSAQIQSDWNQEDNTKVDFIKNKPTIPHLYRHSIQIYNPYSSSYPEIQIYFNHFSNSSQPIPQTQYAISLILDYCCMSPRSFIRLGEVGTPLKPVLIHTFNGDTITVSDGTQLYTIPINYFRDTVTQIF